MAAPSASLSAASLPCLIVPSRASREPAEGAAGLRAPSHAVEEGVHVGERQTGAEFLADVDVLLFDCDGVLWHGDKLLPGIAKLLNACGASGGKQVERELPDDAGRPSASGLGTQQKKIYFLTNNSTKSRRGFLKKLEALGVHATDEQVVCSSVVASWYLQKRRAAFRKEKEKVETVQNAAKEKNETKEETVEIDDSLVYVIGEQGLLEELHNHGFKTIGGPADGEIRLDFQKNKDLAVDFRRDVGTVVVGLDRSFNYYKLQYAQLCINCNDAFFLGTNRDALGNFTPSQVWAGAGTMVQAVEAATGKKAEVAGKPSNILREYLLTHVLGSTPLNRVCLVGDRLDTDICFAQRLGVRSVLALTGVTDAALLLRHIQMRQQAMHACKGPQSRSETDPTVHRRRTGTNGVSNARPNRGREAEAADVVQGEDGSTKRKRLHADAATEDAGHSLDVEWVVPDFVIETAAHLVE
ncbi:UNVERIFIED_CONTAM: HAD hydrolase, family IIA protein [Hammondia hammondi]|eukprot:XP_008886960.1 HAD hydrolase, family IIA protein [Hammondia hammondi]